MKKNSLLTISSTIIILLCLLVAVTAVTWFDLPFMFYIALGVTVFAAIFAMIRLKVLQTQVQKFIRDLSSSLESSGSDVLTTFKMPILVSNENDDIIWYNDAFREGVMNDREVYGEKSSFLFLKTIKTTEEEDETQHIEFEEKIFKVYSSISAIQGATQKITYFIDETNLVNTEREYLKTRPVSAIIVIDSIDEMMQNAKDSVKDQICGVIENTIEEWLMDIPCIFRKISANKFFMVLQEVDLEYIVERRFDILDLVRELDFKVHSSPTLSIGVGRGDSLRECEEMARDALDMALGRGGDQAVVKTNESYQFFGGVSVGVEQRTKVRARIMVSALQKLIESSSNVLIMGHKFPDFDALGSAIGMLTLCKEFGTPTKIVAPTGNSPAGILQEKFIANGFGGDLIKSGDAYKTVTPTTLLICVDTHRADLLENKRLYELCKNVVVIDHHRKTVDYIDDSVIFYHQPHASSTCEMVTELIQYVDERIINKFEAEALLAGIMLDTRNFVLRTGVRTFEASAFLRSRGADPVEVKKIFSGSIELYRERTSIVTSAEIYEDCAISETDTQTDVIRVSAAQAADELLNIVGVNASFVIFWEAGSLNVSARSLGGINVQLIMEKLGGGGHQTMAAARFDCETAEVARQQLMQAIDQYKLENAPSENLKNKES